MTKQADIQYWAKKLQENEDKLRPLRHKMFHAELDFTFEEKFELRELLVQSAALVTILNETMARPDPKPRWKTLFRK